MCRLSIVTVTLNNLELLKSTMDSLLPQLNKMCEYIVIDGGSTDGTIKYLESNRILYVTEKDHGIYDAMNKGLKMAKGEWIYYLNAGDFLLPGVIQKFLDIESHLKEIDAIYGNVILTMRYNNRIYALKEKADKKISNIKKGMICSHQGLFCKRDTMLDSGGFDCSFRIAGDWDLISRIYTEGARFKYIDCYISMYDQSGASIKPHPVERHRVRKNNRFYKYIDWYMVKDLCHDIKSVISTKFLGEKKKLLAIKIKRYEEVKYRQYLL